MQAQALRCFTVSRLVKHAGAVAQKLWLYGTLKEWGRVLEPEFMWFSFPPKSSSDGCGFVVRVSSAVFSLVATHTFCVSEFRVKHRHHRTATKMFTPNAEVQNHFHSVFMVTSVHESCHVMAGESNVQQEP